MKCRKNENDVSFASNISYLQKKSKRKKKEKKSICALHTKSKLLNISFLLTLCLNLHCVVFFFYFSSFPFILSFTSPEDNKETTKIENSASSFIDENKTDYLFFSNKFFNYDDTDLAPFPSNSEMLFDKSLLIGQKINSTFFFKPTDLPIESIPRPADAYNGRKFNLYAHSSSFLGDFSSSSFFEASNNVSNSVFSSSFNLISFPHNDTELAMYAIEEIQHKKKLDQEKADKKRREKELLKVKNLNVEAKQNFSSKDDNTTKKIK